MEDTSHFIIHLTEWCTQLQIWIFFTLNHLQKFSLWSLVKIVLSNSISTHCCLVKPFNDIDLGQHWVWWWLGSWQHQALPKPMLNYYQHYWQELLTCGLGQFHYNCSGYHSLQSAWNEASDNNAASSKENEVKCSFPANWNSPPPPPPTHSLDISI